MTPSESGNWTQATLVGGECSHHYASPTPQINLFSSFHPLIWREALRVTSLDWTKNAKTFSVDNGYYLTITVAMLVYPTNPPGIELYYQANVFFCVSGKTSLWLMITWVKTLYCQALKSSSSPQIFGHSFRDKSGKGIYQNLKLISSSNLLFCGFVVFVEVILAWAP